MWLVRSNKKLNCSLTPIVSQTSLIYHIVVLLFCQPGAEVILSHLMFLDKMLLTGSGVLNDCWQLFLSKKWQPTGDSVMVPR
jgi:hypothetical protein